MSSFVRMVKSLTLGQYKDIATVLATVVALATLVVGVREYERQGAQKRAEYFAQMRVRMKENNTFKEIFALAEADDSRLAEIPFKDKRDVLGFFDEIAIGIESGLIRPEVAHYMFGYYAIRCGESKNFLVWSQ